MFKKISSYPVLICCPLFLAALIGPLSASACNWGNGASTPQDVFDRSCRQQGGVPHGCSCDAPTSGSSGSGGYSGSDPLVQGAAILGNALGKALGDAILGNPQQDAANQAAAAQAAEQQRQAEEQQRQIDEQRTAEALRQQEIAKQRILSQLKGSESSPGLALKTGEEDTPLTVTETRGALGSTVVTATGIGSLSDEHGLQLKLGDDAETSSRQAGQGFDTAGKIMGSTLPVAPPTPTSKSSAEKLQLLNVLRSKLKQNQADEQSLNDQLALLQRAPTPDPVAISQVQDKIVVKEAEKKKIILDLTADDPDAPAETGQSSSNSDATSK